MTKAERKSRVELIRSQLAGAAGFARKAHFEAGGTVSGWRGQGNVYKNRRKAKNKKACRGRVRDEG